MPTDACRPDTKVLAFSGGKRDSVIDIGWKYAPSRPLSETWSSMYWKNASNAGPSTSSMHNGGAGSTGVSTTGTGARPVHSSHDIGDQPLLGVNGLVGNSGVRGRSGFFGRNGRIAPIGADGISPPCGAVPCSHATGRPWRSRNEPSCSGPSQSPDGLLVNTLPLAWNAIQSTLMS